METKTTIFLQNAFPSKQSKGIFCYLLAMLALSLLQISFNTSFTDKLSFNSLQRLWSSLSQIVCMGLIPFAAYLLLTCIGKKSGDMFLTATAKELRYSAPKKPILWLIAVVFGILFYLLTLVTSQVFNTILIITTDYTYVHSQNVIYSDFGDLVMWIFFTAMLPAIFEELTHRGILLSSLEEGGSEARTVLLSALCFSLMHTNIVQTGYTFVGGLILGYITIRSGSIFPAMIIHFINNGLATIDSYSSQHGGVFSRMMDSYYSLFGRGIGGLVLIFILWATIIASVVGLLIVVSRLTQDKEATSNKKMLFGVLEIGVKDKNQVSVGKPQATIYLVTAIVLVSFQTITSLISGMLR